jgi:hypothetical protein
LKEGLKISGERTDGTDTTEKSALKTEKEQKNSCNSMVEGRRMFFLCRTDSTEKITTRNNRKSKKLLHFHG